MSPTTTHPTVFVCGATGTQGSAVALHLRRLGWAVHATSRSPDSPASQALQTRGVRVTGGDWDDAAALKTSMAGCGMLFLNLVPSFDDPNGERTRARRILDAARAAGVTHVVYSSGAGANAPEALPKLEPNSFVEAVLHSKRDIEKMVREAGFENWTILRPCNLMANYLLPKVAMLYPGLVETGTWTTAFAAETPLPLTDEDDLAKFAVAAFQDAARFRSQAITIASVILAPGAIVAQLSAATGRPLRVVFMTDREIEAQKAVNPLVQGQFAGRDMAKLVDMESLESWGIRLGSFADYLTTREDAVKATYS